MQYVYQVENGETGNPVNFLLSSKEKAIEEATFRLKHGFGATKVTTNPADPLGFAFGYKDEECVGHYVIHLLEIL